MTQTNSGTPHRCPAVNAFGRMYADQALCVRLDLRRNRNQPNAAQPGSMESRLPGRSTSLKFTVSRNWQAIQLMPRLNRKKTGMKIRNLISWLRGMFMFFIVKTPFSHIFSVRGCCPLLCFHYSTESMTTVLQILCHTFCQKSPETAYCTKIRRKFFANGRIPALKSEKSAEYLCNPTNRIFSKNIFRVQNSPVSGDTGSPFEWTLSRLKKIHRIGE